MTRLDKNTLLVVDDELALRLMMRRMLEREGYTVSEAGDGVEALAAFECLHFGLILLDVMMPNLDGFETCIELRKRPDAGRVPILMVTALNDDMSITRAFEVGATDYITKLIHWILLRWHVRNLLDSAHSAETLDLREHALAATRLSLLTIDPNQPNCPITSVNAAFVTMTSYTFTGMLGKNLRMLFGAQSDATAVKMLERSLC